MHIEIIHQDEQIVVVNKPIDLPVHKNDHMPKDANYLTKLVGQQIDHPVYNVHRLDAKTSGIIVLALSREVAHNLTVQFEQRKVQKKYTALVREKPEQEMVLDSPVFDKKKRKKFAAETHIKLLQCIPTNITYRTFENIHMSIVEASPTTGRWHQIRQHLGQKRHDIIGDVQHGDRTLNKLIAEETGISRLMLHAHSLEFLHPETGQLVKHECEVPKEFEKIMEAYG